jgi:hypothetical protein
MLRVLFDLTLAEDLSEVLRLLSLLTVRVDESR